MSIEVLDQSIDEYSATWLIGIEYSIDTQILVSYRKYSILSIAPPILSICPTMVVWIRLGLRVGSDRMVGGMALRCKVRWKGKL